MSITQHLKEIKKSLPQEVTLVAVSKTKPVSDLMEAYEAGQRVFGENKIQEMAVKWEEMPKDIEWHMIGHVQTNKVKYMAPFVHLIHAVDSLKLLKEINKQAKRNDRVIDCLLQLKIAEEESKFGLSKEEAQALISSSEIEQFTNIRIIGLMGMATFTEDQEQLKREFKSLKVVFENFRSTHKQLSVLSMGMSGDYKLAIEHGSNMVRIGSSIFGSRNYT